MKIKQVFALIVLLGNLAGAMPSLKEDPATNKIIYDIIKRDDRKWHKINSNSLFYFGIIDHATRTNFFAAITPSIKNIYIESPGGSVDAALDIGLYIADHNMSVAPRRFCLSSCANYIFLAAKEKVIPKGYFVGFHGDSHTVKGDEDENWNVVMNYREDIFLKKIGVPQKFFNCSVKFVIANDGKMWIPMPQDYARYNIKNVKYDYSANRNDYPSIEDFDKFTYQNTSKEWTQECGR